MFTMRLWLDDIRPKPAEFDFHVLTAEDAIELLKGGQVTHVSLDNDLGEGLAEGYTVADWIEEQAYHNQLSRLIWAVHSANPVARKKIKQALTNADRFWTNNETEKTY